MRCAPEIQPVFLSEEDEAGDAGATEVLPDESVFEDAAEFLLIKISDSSKTCFTSERSSCFSY